MLVIGTRPEAIKLAPVARALSGLGLPLRLVFTGQHASLDPGEHGLAGFPAAHLGCRGRSDPHAHVAEVRSAAGRLFRAQGAELVVVQGDTSSALGGALAAKDAGIPLAHVEAGLRTGDLEQPWPEEAYRIEIDRVSDLLFAPTEISAANLRREKVRGAIAVTGNTGIDAVLEVERSLPPAVRNNVHPLILVSCHRRESWGAGLASVAAAVRDLASGGRATLDVLLHPNEHVARTMRRELAGCRGVHLIAPSGHRELVRRMRSADLVLSDSGGMQEEAPVLGVPLLVLRDKTERPEGLATGNAMLVGTDRGAVVRAVDRLLSDHGARAAMARKAFPYGDGKAAPRIAAIIAKQMGAAAAA